MVKKKLWLLFLGLPLVLSACSQPISQNNHEKRAISRISEVSKSLTTAQHQNSAEATETEAATYEDLQKLEFKGTQQITINHNDPGFSASELEIQKPWESYHDLDQLNRAVEAEALLNQSLMPTEKRQPLFWNPTGWHNKKMPNGTFLYNRSHLIGYQMTGQNNNPKNLMTGTVSLNNPEMLVNESTIASYLKESPKHYVRYSVRPVYRGDELVARGVWMRAQSLGDQRIRLNSYIFNVQEGMTIDYSTGYSNVATNKSSSTSQSQAPLNSQKIWGNRRSKVYHVPGQPNYESGLQNGNSQNQVWFNSEEEAQQAGYRKAKN